MKFSVLHRGRRHPDEDGRSLVVNRPAGQTPTIQIDIAQGSNPGLLKKQDTITIVSWNLGYAGLGDRANFVADGGTDFLPISQEYVAENVAGIEETLKRLGADVLFLQELAGPSLINRQTDLRARVNHALNGKASAILTRFANASDSVSIEPASRERHLHAICHVSCNRPTVASGRF